MERTARKKKVNPRAAALAAINDIKEGKRKRMDDLDLEDDVEDGDISPAGTEELAGTDDEHDDAEAHDSSIKPGKVPDSPAKKNKKKKAKDVPVDMRAQYRMQNMFANATARQQPRAEAEDDDLLEQMLMDMDSCVPALPSARLASRRPGRASLPKHRAPPCRKSYTASPSGDEPPPATSPQALLDRDEEPAADLPSLDADVDSLSEARAAPSDTPDNVIGTEPFTERAPSAPDDRTTAAAVACQDTGGEEGGCADVERPKNRMFIVSDEPEQSAGPAAGWQAALDGSDDVDAACEADAEMETDGAEADEGKGEHVAEAEMDASDPDALRFFFMDAHYEPSQAGTVFLVGKVKRDAGFVSACAVVKGIKQCLFIVPKPFVFQDGDGELARLEADAAEDGSKRGALSKYLHRRCADLKAEVRERLARHCTEMTMMPVQRTYAFEDGRVPRGRQWVLKVRCDAAPGAVPSELTGRHFVAVLGVTQTPLEALLLKRRLMGPSWLLLHRATEVETQARVSWCKAEFTVPGPKMVQNVAGTPPPCPPLVVAGINVKALPDSGNEVVAASVVHCQVRMDTPADTARWQAGRDIQHFSVLRKLDGSAWPLGLQALVKARNAKNKPDGGGESLSAQATERALLAYLLVRLHNLDADVIVGHNIGNWDLTIVLQRMQHHKVPHWSRLGRFKRSRMPNLTGGGNVFGGGASQGVLSCIAGRLLVDTYVCSREILREVEYSLGSLAAKLLNQQRTDLNPNKIRGMCEAAQSFMQLVGHGESDAWLALGLLTCLSIIPLSLQLATVSGFLWSRTLQGNRAQRIEMLLLHEFHRRKFLLPDKPERGAKAAAGKAAAAATGDEAAAGGAPATGKSKPQYTGGLVLEPKKGLYNKYILLLDFNSLYPSIIQEYNICFTTTQRPKDDSIPPLPSSGAELAPLPVVIQGLVQRRRHVKSAMKGCKDPVKLRQLDIRQQALKLTANSMYGCLGFTASRFYAKPLAQLITSQGREILQSTVDLVQSNLNLDVIYGDTDSIMVATGSTDVAQVMQLGAQIKKVVNKHYQLLEIDLDGIFKTMLLLKKKKYAAVKIEPTATPGQFKEVTETKGLDIVRRDWCQLSRDVGHECLQHILSGRDAEEITEAIHERLRAVREQLNAGLIPLDKFVITKQLTKRPEDYPDAKSQAHVQVALRMRQRGMQEGTQPGDVVAYVICVDTAAAGAPPAAGKGLAERAYHPQEVMSQESLQVDTAYYLSQQLHPVVARLCATLESTSEGRLAECLGLDASKFRHSVPAADGAFAVETTLGGQSLLDDDERFGDCPRLALRSPRGTAFELGDLPSLVEDGTQPTALVTPPQCAADDAADCLSPAQLTNQAVLAARKLVLQFYDGELRSEDESLPCRTTDVSLACQHPRLGACAPGTCPLDPECGGFMAPLRSEPATYLQLSSLERQLDVDRLLRRVRVAKGSEAEKRFAAARAHLAGAARAMQRFVRSAAYHWVRVADVFGALGLRD